MKKLIALLAALAFAGTACATTINFNSGSATPRHHRVVKHTKKHVKKNFRRAPQARHHHHGPVHFHR